MRKLMISIFVVLVMAFMVAIPKVEAYLIEVEGYVNPLDPTDNSDGTTTFSEVTYTFTVTSADSDVEMNFLSLEFESAVFVSIGMLTGIDPADWSTFTWISGSGSINEIASAGTTLLGEGDTLTLTFTDVVVYNNALTDAGLWGEGQIWAQSWAVSATGGGIDGGSTAVTPEPATLMLLGSGFIGAGLYRWRRKRRKSRKF